MQTQIGHALMLLAISLHVELPRRIDSWWELYISSRWQLQVTDDMKLTEDDTCKTLETTAIGDKSYKCDIHQDPSLQMDIFVNTSWTPLKHPMDFYMFSYHDIISLQTGSFAYLLIVLEFISTFIVISKDSSANVFVFSRTSLCMSNLLLIYSIINNTQWSHRQDFWRGYQQRLSIFPGVEIPWMWCTSKQSLTVLKPTALI